MRIRKQSHPSWVRGLKPNPRYLEWNERGVAPLVGAWIETLTSCSAQHSVSVAPLVGAWIETLISHVMIRGARRTPRGCVD